MGKVLLFGVLCAAACGRMGFDPGEPDATIATTPLVKCGAQPRFQVGASSIREMKAIPTANGFAILTLNTAAELRGWVYAWQGDTLVAGPQNVMIDVDVTGAFGAVTVGDNVLATAIHGAMATLGTTYYPLTATLAARGAPVVVSGRVSGVAPLATCGTCNAIASVRYENSDVAVHDLDMAGAESSVRTLGVATEAPSELSIATGHLGYAAAWVQTQGSPNVTRLALLDKYYAMIKGPVAVMNTAGFDTIRPRIVWAPQSRTYGVTWFEKTPSNDDDLYGQIFDEQLAPLIAPTRLATNASSPLVTSNGTGFFVAFRQYSASNPEQLDVVYLATNGAATLRTIGTSGGTPAAFAVVQRAGQPVLVYGESGGNGPDLWFDAMCP